MNYSSAMNYSSEEKEIDLLRLGRALVKKLWLIILAAILGGAVGFGISNFLIAPKYTAKALMYVNNSSLSVGGTKVSISASELTAAQSLVDTYTVILQTRKTLNQVIKDADLPYTVEELTNMIKAAPVNNTEVFEIDVTSTDPLEAEKIANSIAETLPHKIADIVEGSSVKIVDYAIIPSRKSYPSITRFTAIGAMLCFLLVSAVVVVQELLNDEIKDEADLQTYFQGLPILASIPDLSSTRSGYGYYKISAVDQNDSSKNDFSHNGREV